MAGKGVLKASYNPPGSGGTSGTPPAQPSAVVLSEPGPRTLEQPLERTATTMAVVCTVGTTTADRAKVWLSRLSPWTTWEDQGEFEFSPGAPTIYFPAYAPNTAQTWKAKVSLGNPDGYSDPSTATVSAGFTIAAIAPPGVVGAALTVPSGAGGTFPYDATLPNGHHYWVIPGYTWSDTPRDSSSFFYRVTAEDLGAGGVSVRAEEATSGTIVSPSGTVQTASLMGEYGRAGNGANRTGDIEAVKLRLYLCSRVDETTDAWRNALASTLQDTVTITVAVGAAIPTDLVDMSAADPATLGAGVYVDPSTGELITSTGDNPGNMLANGDFDRVVIGSNAVGWDFTGTAYPVLYSVSNSTAPNILRMAGTAFARQGPFTVRPGQLYYVEAMWLADTGTNGGIGLAADYYDYTGAYVSSDVVTATAASILSTTTLTRQGLACTVPSGAVSMKFRINTFSNTTGFYLVDGCILRPQLTTGTGLQPDGHGGVRVPLLGIDDTLLAAQAVTAAKMAANAITAANNALAANSVVNANMVDVSISKVTYGTSIFAGDVILSRGISKPVIVLGNTGLNLFGQADASTGATGLTSLPNVAIQSSGLSLFSGANTSVTVTSSAVTLWSVNGSTSNPYVAITSASATFASGSNSVVVTGSGITITQASGGTFTANSTGFSISKSSNSVAVDASGITITQASGATLQMSSTGLALTKGTTDLTVTSTTITLTNGSRTLTLNSAGALILSDGSFNCVLTSTSVVSNNISAAQSIAVTGSGGIDMSGGSGALNYPSSLLTVTASVGPIAYPAACAGFITVKVGGTNFKQLLFNV